MMQWIENRELLGGITFVQNAEYLQPHDDDFSALLCSCLPPVFDFRPKVVQMFICKKNSEYKLCKFNRKLRGVLYVHRKT